MLSDGNNCGVGHLDVVIRIGELACYRNGHKVGGFADLFWLVSA